LPPQHGSRIGLMRELSTALWIDGDVDAAELTLAESINAARAVGDTRLEWYGRLERAARNAATRGETDALVTTAERAVDVFDALGDDLGLARAWRRLGLVGHTQRRFSDAAVACERALPHAGASGDEQERARVADLLCTALLLGPARVEEAVERVEAILASAERNAVLRAHVSTSLAGLVAMRGDFERARELYRDAGSVYQELGLRLPRVGWTQIVAAVEALAGDSEAAFRALREGYAVLDSGGLDSLRTSHAALLAFALASADEIAAARPYARVCETFDGTLDPDTIARLRAAQAQFVDETIDAERLAREAIEATQGTDNLNLQAEMRLVLARVLDDPAEAAAARALFEAKGNIVSAATTGLWSRRP
jgi:tetratricopeptide (TPR) repeat protein